MKYTASKKLIKKIVTKEEQQKEIKVNLKPVNNIEHLYDIIKETSLAKQKNQDMTNLEFIKIIIDEIIDQKHDLGFYDIEDQILKIRLTNLYKTRKTKDQYLWALLRTIYHECNHALFYQKIIPQDNVAKFKMNLDYILAEISNYYKIYHDNFYIEILANNYSIKKTISLVKKYPDLYQEVEQQAKTTKLLYQIHSQNYDAHQPINHISSILKNEDTETKNKDFAEIECLASLFTKDGHIKLEDYQDTEIKYIIASSPVYLNSIDFNEQSNEDLAFILESLSQVYNLEQIKKIKNIKLMKEVEILKEELSKTKSEFICTEHLIPILEGKQKRNKNKIKYLELQIKKINQLIEERTRTKKLVIKPSA